MRLLLALCVAATLLLVACGGGSSGGEILFVATGNDGNLDVFLTQADGRWIKNLTDHPEHDFGATWSPDGTKIAFFSTRDEEVQSTALADLYVMDADGGNVERVAEIEAISLSGLPAVSWNSDGRRLLYLEGNELRITDVNGVVYDPDVESRFTLAWSPDGERIVFLGRRDERPDEFAFWSIHPYALEAQRLFSPVREQPCSHDPRVTRTDEDRMRLAARLALSRPNGRISYDIQFSPADGDALYWLEICRDGVINYELALRDREFVDERLLTEDPEDEFIARWSPDGTKIAYVREPLDEPPSIWVMNPDGANKTLVAEEAGQFSWSPDGSRIAFVGTTTPGSYTRDDFALFTVNVDGTDRRLIADGLGLIRTLEWSPVE